MKKRLSIFALIVGLIVAFGVPAWATDSVPATEIQLSDNTKDWTSSVPIYHVFGKAIAGGSSTPLNEVTYKTNGTDYTPYWAITTTSSFSNNTSNLSVNGLTIALENSNANATKKVTISGYPNKKGDVKFYLWAGTNAETLTKNNSIKKEIKFTVTDTTKLTMSADEVISANNYDANQSDVTFKVAGAGALKEAEVVDWSVSDADKAKLLEYFGQTALTTNIFDAVDNKNEIKLLRKNAKKIGKFDFTLIATAGSATEGTTKHEYLGYPVTVSKKITLNIVGSSPDIKFCTDITGSNATEATGDNSTDITANYDSANKALYIGKDITKTMTQGSDSSKLGFAITGASQDMKITSTVSPSGSGIDISFDKTESVQNKANDLRYKYALKGVAAKAGDYILKITAKNAQTTVEKSFTFKINPLPVITTSKLSDVKWGVSYDATIQSSDVTSISLREKPFGNPTGTLSIPSSLANNYKDNYYGVKQIADGTSGLVTPYIKDGKLNDLTKGDGKGAAGLLLTSETGKIEGMWKVTSADNTADVIKLTDKNKLERAILVTATAGTGDGAVIVYRTISLDFVAASPVINETATAIQSALYGSNNSSLFYSNDVTISQIATATGPGILSWDVVAANAVLKTIGLEVDSTSSTQTDNTIKLVLKGKPNIITPRAGVTVPFKVTSSVTDDTASVSVNIVVKAEENSTYATISADATEAALPSGNAKNGEKFSDVTKLVEDNILGVDTKAGYTDTITLFAEPGPLTWTAKNLPDGVTLTVSADDTRFATLTTGTNGLKTATKLDDNNQARYTITLKNANLGSSVSKVISGDLRVWDTPALTTTSLSGLTVDKEWKPKLAFTGNPMQVTVTFDTLVKGTGDAEGYYVVDADKSKVGVSFDQSSFQFNGTLDRIPQEDGDDEEKLNQFTVKVLPKNYANKDATETKDLTVTVKGVKPKLDKAAITLKDGGSATITTSAGTPDITLKAYIANKDAKKIFGITGDDDVDLTSEPHYGLKFTAGTDEEAGTGTLAYSGGETYAFKDLPVTVSATNLETGTDNPVTAVYKVTVEGPAPKWDNSDETSVTVYAVAGLAIEDLTYTATVTEPYEITLSPKAGVAKNGLTATVSEKAVTISGTPASDKETKTQFSLTATNTSTKQKVTKKITVIGLLPPTITSTSDKLKKEITFGKKISLKPAAKGSKTLTWRIGEGGDIEDEAGLTALGLDFSSKTGAITGTPTGLTLNDSGAYATQTVALEVYNASVDEAAADDSTYHKTVMATIGVKGGKTKVTTKSITILKGDSDRGELRIATNPAATAETGVSMTFNASGLPSGITVDASTGIITIEDDSSLQATKGTAAQVEVSNAGTTAKGKVKFIINDAAPEFSDVEIPGITAQEKSKATGGATLSVTNRTGDTKIKWAVKTAPKKSQAKIKASGNGESATLTITVPKNLKNADDEDIPENIVVTATNTRTKAVSELPLTYTITPVPTQETATAEDAKFDQTADATAKEKAATGEGEVKFGKTRTAPTAAQLGAIQKVLGDGYVIAAVLPEIEVTAEGQYDFEVDLDEKVAEGAELVWFAFPESGKETEDDEIVDFYTKAGEDTKVVPEDHVLVVSPWLNAEVKYEPVIAVKVDAAEAEAVDAESVKEAAEEQAAE